MHSLNSLSRCSMVLTLSLTTVAAWARELSVLQQYAHVALSLESGRLTPHGTKSQNNSGGSGGGNVYTRSLTRCTYKPKCSTIFRIKSFHRLRPLSPKAHDLCDLKLGALGEQLWTGCPLRPAPDPPSHRARSRLYSFRVWASKSGLPETLQLCALEVSLHSIPWKYP